MIPRVRMLPCGERGLVVEFGTEIAPGINARVHRLAKMISAEMRDRVLEVVPTYCSLMVYFDPLAISGKALQEEIAPLLRRLDSRDAASEVRRIITIPVCYGGDFGPDLAFVARHNAIPEDEVIAIHTAAPYLIYMLGFTPGFPYLGGVPERIAAPRLETPRIKVPAGSVGIAGTQTGIYPIESPGGWRLIGRTPLRLFDPSSDRPFLLAAGDWLQFSAVSADEFRRIEQQVESGKYSPHIQLVRGERVHGH